MSFKLFIDDKRSPPSSGWIVARSSDEAIKLIEERGLPKEIAFDYGLGGDDTTMAVIEHIENLLMETEEKIPKDFGFSYSVHSANSVGRDNITFRMENLLKHFMEQ